MQIWKKVHTFLVNKLIQEEDLNMKKKY